MTDDADNVCYEIQQLAKAGRVVALHLEGIEERLSVSDAMFSFAEADGEVLWLRRPEVKALRGVRHPQPDGKVRRYTKLYALGLWFTIAERLPSILCRIHETDAEDLDEMLKAEDAEDAAWAALPPEQRNSDD